MNDFVFLYRGGERMPAPSPEQAQQSMQRWMNWLKDLSEKGHVKDPGHPLERVGKVVKGGHITDGPFAEAKDVIGGYTLIHARDLAHAAELTTGCPILEVPGGFVEVRPVMQM